MAIELLVVDEDPMVRRLLERMLGKYVQETAGIPFALAENGEEALKIAEQNLDNLKVVMTDTNMPIMDGYQLIENLRAKGYKNQIVQMTGNIDNQKSPYANYMLRKPFTIDDIKKLFSEYKTSGKLCF